LRVGLTSLIAGKRLYKGVGLVCKAFASIDYYQTSMLPNGRPLSFA
jgi:hypothetical protein